MTTKHLLSCEGACDYSKLENEIKTKFGAWCAKKKIYFVITTTSRSFTLSKALVSAFFLKKKSGMIPTLTNKKHRVSTYAPKTHKQHPLE